MGCCSMEDEEGEWKDIYEDPVRPRHHGWECPPDFLQVCSWLLIVAIVVLHYMVQIVFLKGAFFIVVMVLSSCVVGSTIISKIVLELYHQEDPVVFRTDLPRLEADELVEENAPEGTDPCVFCRRFVIKGSKHCSVCDKCIPGFDHHCRWLNSCVGDKNYYLFAYFMGSAFVGMVWVIAISLYTIIVSLRDIDKFKEEYMMHRVYHSPSRAFPAIVVFNFVCLGLSCMGAGALGKLISFHIYLAYSHQTTYEHILKKRQKKKERGEYKKSHPQEDTSCCACVNLKRRRDFKKHSKMKNAEAEREPMEEEVPPLEAPQRRRYEPYHHSRGTSSDADNTEEVAFSSTGMATPRRGAAPTTASPPPPPAAASAPPPRLPSRAAAPPSS